MAEFFGKPRSHTDLLRTGLADTLAVMGANDGERPLADGNSAQAHVDSALHRVLAAANADASGQYWVSLADVLPTLAEAAPGQFLDAVSTGLNNGTISLDFFTDGESRGFFATGSPHTSLLWALEAVAWDRGHLSAVVLALARLAELDPGGTLINRPLGSLRSIFLLWYPQTAASQSDRLDVLDLLREAHPAVAWELMLAILPRGTDVAHPTYAPRWRDWKPEDPPVITTGERVDRIQTIVTRLLADAGSDGTRLAAVVELLDSLPPAERIRIAEYLGEIGHAEDLGALWAALRGLLYRHQRFPEADWALSPDELDRLAALYSSFEPSDPNERFAWLFRFHVELPDLSSDDLAAHRTALSERRGEALEKLYRERGLEGLWSLAEAVEAPANLGQAIPVSMLHSNDAAEILSGLEAESEARRRLVLGYVAGQFKQSGWAWAEPLLDEHGANWSAIRAARFLLALPASTRTWWWLAKLAPGTTEAYWSAASPFRLETPGEVQHAVERLLEQDRAYAAIGLLVRSLEMLFDVRLTIAVLEKAASMVPSSDDDVHQLAGDIQDLLDRLDASGAVSDDDLDVLEFRFVHLLQGLRRPTKRLYRAIARDPALFVELLTWAFKGRHDERSEESSEKNGRAKLAAGVLSGCTEVPGMLSDGSVSRTTLERWVYEARKLAADRDRAEISDSFIGRLLSRLPQGSDGVWPHPEVRRLVETLASPDLETGLECGVMGSRGPTWRGLYDGGEQERELARTYRGYAEAVAVRYPRTTSMLRRIAAGYESYAQHMDEQADLRQES